MATLNVADLNRQGKVFVAANVSAISHIAVTTGMTGLILWNPVGSPVKLVLVDWGFVWTTIPGAVHNIGLAQQVSTNFIPTGLTVAGRSAVSADGAGNVPNGVAWSAATLGVAPVAVRWALGAAWITGGSGEAPYGPFVDRVDGSLVVVPGAAVCTTVVNTTAIGMAHMTWIEVPK